MLYVPMTSEEHQRSRGNAWDEVVTRREGHTRPLGVIPKRRFSVWFPFAPTSLCFSMACAWPFSTWHVSRGVWSQLSSEFARAFCKEHLHNVACVQLVCWGG